MAAFNRLIWSASHGARGYTARTARDNGFQPSAFRAMAVSTALYGMNCRHWILRRTGRSGKGRWVAWLIGLAVMLVAFLLLLFYLGRPVAPRNIEVDVTDLIAGIAASKDKQ